MSERIDVVARIPTCKDLYDTIKQQSEMLTNAKLIEFIYVSALKASAAVNRNDCLNNIKSELVIMLDDDITGFYPGWDADLIQPLIENDNISIVSARLMNSDTTYANVMHDNFIYVNGYHRSPINLVPTAGIAFRPNGIKFDENYIKASFEDTDWCKQISQRYPHMYTVINNNCKLIHLNEMKFQVGEAWNHNRSYYISKWGSL